MASTLKRNALLRTVRAAWSLDMRTWLWAICRVWKPAFINRRYSCKILSVWLLGIIPAFEKH